MATLQKIREEIEHLDELMIFVPVDEKCNKDYKCGYEHALEEVRNFLDTLQEEKVDLDKEITDYINKHFHIRNDETLENGNDPLTTYDFEEIAKHFYELGKQSSDCPKIKGWVARDKDDLIGDGKILYFGINKPKREEGCWGDFDEYMALPSDMFPDLKWEDAPIEVELTIKKV